MSDSVRMMDLAVLTRNLEEFRRMDPEHRLHAERIAARAAVRHLEELHEDVAGTERAQETRVDDRRGRDGGRRGRRQPDHEEDAPADTSPEREEGVLLDIKV